MFTFWIFQEAVTNPRQGPNLSGVLLGIIGTAAAGFLFSMFSEGIRRWHEKKVLKASLVAEVRGVMERYEIVGTGIRAAKQWSDLQFALQKPIFDYFAIFDANASRIGLLEEETAAQFTTLYVLAKGHFQDLIFWGDSVLLQHGPVDDAVIARRNQFLHVIKRDDARLVELAGKIVNGTK